MIADHAANGGDPASIADACATHELAGLATASPVSSALLIKSLL
jgi:hypothetical protein